MPRAPIQAYKSLILASNPLAYYRLDEASGNFADISGNTNTATAVGGITYSQTGALPGDTDTAILLNGSTGYATAGNVVAMNSLAAVTVEAWVKLTSTGGGNRMIAGKADFGTPDQAHQAFYLKLFGTRLDVGGRNSGGTFNEVEIANAITDTARWHHVVGTYDGTNFIAYVDGCRLGSAALAGPLGNATSVPFTIGVSGNLIDSFFNGSIDEVAIYPTALSAAVVMQHYAAGQSIARTLAGPRISTATLPAASFVAANSQYLSHASNASLQTGNIDFTVAGWLYKTANDGQGACLASRYDDNAKCEYVLRVDGNRLPYFSVSAAGDGNGNSQLDVFSTAISVAAWHHIVAWFDSVAKTINICVDNGTVHTVSAPNGVFASTSTLQLGAFFGSHVGANCRIQYTGFWKKAPSAAEITRLYNVGKGLTAAQVLADATLPTSLISYWALTEQSGTRKDSVVASGNDLTSNNGVSWAAGITQDVAVLRTVAGARQVA